jgi:hypothetical protein
MLEDIRERQEDLGKKKAGLKERGPDFEEKKEDSEEGIMYPSLEREADTTWRDNFKENDVGKEDGENIKRNEEHLGESMESFGKENENWPREEDTKLESIDSEVWKVKVGTRIVRAVVL